ncbi:MAG: hypothetical protein R2774_13495 [Saprospiraceae bacterium]
MAKDKNDLTTAQNLEYVSEKAEKSKRGGVQDDTKEQLKRNLKDKNLGKK